MKRRIAPGQSVVFLETDLNMLPKSFAYILAILAIFLVSSSQLIIKWRFEKLAIGQRADQSLWGTVATMLSDPFLWFAGFFIVASAASWYAALSRLPLSFMLPLGATVAPLVVLGANIWLGEEVSASQAAAIAVIAISVGWLGLSQS